MRIIYYRNSDGEITQHSAVPTEWSDDELALRLLEFNEKHPDHPATLIVVEENSFEAYLLNAIKKAKQRAADDIRAALDAIEEARDAIQDLEAN